MIRRAKQIYAEYCEKFAQYNLPIWAQLEPQHRRHWRDLAWKEFWSC